MKVDIKKVLFEKNPRIVDLMKVSYLFMMDRIQNFLLSGYLTNETIANKTERNLFHIFGNFKEIVCIDLLYSCAAVAIFCTARHERSDRFGCII
jgi:hypothetical protein